jgi:hypothetical protein
LINIEPGVSFSGIASAVKFHVQEHGRINFGGLGIAGLPGGWPGVIDDDPANTIRSGAVSRTCGESPLRRPAAAFGQPPAYRLTARFFLLAFRIASNEAAPAQADEHQMKAVLLCESERRHAKAETRQ